MNIKRKAHATQNGVRSLKCAGFPCTTSLTSQGGKRTSCELRKKLHQHCANTFVPGWENGWKSLGRVPWISGWLRVCEQRESSGNQLGSLPVRVKSAHSVYLWVKRGPNVHSVSLLPTFQASFDMSLSLSHKHRVAAETRVSSLSDSISQVR